MVEQRAVNALVASSNLALGGIVYERRLKRRSVLYSSAFCAVLTLGILFAAQDTLFVSVQTTHSAQ